jgi:hypothetical protein
MTSTTQNAGIAAGVHVDRAGGPEVTYKQNLQVKFSTDAEILNSKSTATEIQLAKVIALLRTGPKTTIELRQHGIMMPAARVFQLKREHDYAITTELLALYDTEGIRHSKCARYHLVEQPGHADPRSSSQAQARPGNEAGAN